MAAPSNTCVSCACQICSGIRGTVHQIFRVLEIYGWMLDAYVVDFFQDDLWERLPSVWRNFIDEITSEELGNWILRECGSKRVWPLSLLALRRFVESAEISRDHKRAFKIKCLSKLSSKNEMGNILESDDSEISPKHVQFDNLFTKHVKTKKRYEINTISQIIAESAKEASCKCIVDIGSGMGHLARVLTYKHELNVVCVERDRALLEGARKWDEQLAASLAKRIPDFRKRKPHHVSLTVDNSPIARQQLVHRMTNIFNNHYQDHDSHFGLIGLHPCGDLAATLIRLYANEQNARFICLVGCCYMKLTFGEGTEKGYPMSKHFQTDVENCKLSYAALEVACHAVEKHCDKLKTNNYADLIVHAYRAVLELLLIEKNPGLRHTQLKNTKITKDTSFKEYCESTTECLESKDRPNDSDFERADVKNFLQQWKRVLVFGSLRLLLAPLVETLVLFDRFLYLSELNLSPSLKAEFDSRVSPRNILLVSIKQKD